MTIADIPAGASVFLDANVLVCHFMPHPVFGDASTELVERIGRGEIVGVTSAHALSELAHRLMTIEANTVLGWPFQGMVRRLKRHPAEVSKLSQFRKAIDELLESRIRVLAVGGGLVKSAAAVSVETGLLSGDALVVAIMREHGLTHLASHDGDFDRVPGITRYALA